MKPSHEQITNLEAVVRKSHVLYHNDNAEPRADLVESFGWPGAVFFEDQQRCAAEKARLKYQAEASSNMSLIVTPPESL